MGLEGTGTSGWRRRTRAGVRACAALCALVLLGGCLREPPPPTDPELAAELGLPPGTEIHRVHLAGREELTRILPSDLEVGEGALVQFVTQDHRIHAIRFLLDEMDGDAAGYLRRTQQTGSPPLSVPGARYILTFEEAPPGRYPFVVEGYGTPTRGLVRVRE